MPLQRVVERDALTDQALAVVDQQPQVELGPVQLRGRQRRRCPSRNAARATAIASMLSDLPRSRPPRRRRPSACRDPHTRSPRAIKNRSKEPDTCRQSSSAQTRSPLQPARPDQQRREPARADLDRLLAQQLAGRRSDRGDRVRALVRVRTEHDH